MRIACNVNYNEDKRREKHWEQCYINAMLCKMWVQCECYKVTVCDYSIKIDIYLKLNLWYSFMPIGYKKKIYIIYF